MPPAPLKKGPATRTTGPPWATDCDGPGRRRSTTHPPLGTTSQREADPADLLRYLPRPREAPGGGVGHGGGTATPLPASRRPAEVGGHAGGGRFSRAAPPAPLGEVRPSLRLDAQRRHDQRL